MKNYIKTLAMLSAMALATSSYALSVSTVPDQALWPGAPVLTTGATPQSTFSVNAGAAWGVANRAVAQIFTTGASGFQLDAVGVYFAGSQNLNMSIHLYQLESIDWTTRGYYNPTYDANDNFQDLWNPSKSGSGLTFNYYGTASQNYVMFDLQGGEELTLLPNTSYAFEIWSSSAAGDVGGTTYWRRDVDPYAGGNVYGADSAAGYGATPETVSRTDIAGGHRDAALALYAVPEPSALALMGLGLAGLLIRRKA